MPTLRSVFLAFADVTIGLLPFADVTVGLLPFADVTVGLLASMPTLRSVFSLLCRRYGRSSLTSICRRYGRSLFLIRRYGRADVTVGLQLLIPADVTIGLV